MLPANILDAGLLAGMYISARRERCGKRGMARKGHQHKQW